MSDDFYGAFDREYLRNDFNRERQSDYRSVFQQDRDRILFAPAFRRLQAKTQVFQAGEYDFYRTRLTHSLEVSRIAESIAIWLRVAQPEVRIDPHLLEGICLAHDIGHPPFGHAGERALNALMEPYGGFEGNAQTLRILTRTIYDGRKGRNGMSPSRALLDGILKYKRLHRDREGDTHHFIYDDQAEILEFCFGTTDLAGELSTKEVNRFQSLECQIMDMADDVAYSSFDVVDGWRARFVTPDSLRSWAEEKGLATGSLERKYLDYLLEMMAQKKLQPEMNKIIGQLITSASLISEENFMTGKTRRHAYRLARQPESEARIKLHKAICKDLVYGSSALQQIEFKGARILRELSGTLLGNYLSTKPAVLLPTDVHRTVIGTDDKAEKARLLCDHISGMTDAYALRSYKRLLDPDYGSISELI